ncbi:MAG TPA: choice-of-anchor tandem repeat GloVer-containing protein [Terriglobales bacterium]
MIRRFHRVTWLILFALASLTQAQTFRKVYSFCAEAGCTDGSTPYAGLLPTSSGLWGTTYLGGSNNGGTVFRVDEKGKLTTVYSFCSQSNCADGSGPYAGLLGSSSPYFYGTTELGGAEGVGTLFKVTIEGAITVFHSFGSGDGFSPYAGLVRAANKEFYGTTGGNEKGGPNISGTVFKTDADGRLTTLHQFCSEPNCSDGANPWGTLVEGEDGNFYGTTAAGGAHICKTRGPEKIGCGTVFKITPQGKLTTLYNFCSRGGLSCSDGVSPLAGLIEASDGSFYGTTSTGGTKAFGTIFRITATGKLTTVHSFQGTDGANPYGGLIQASDGYFYGTTTSGGANDRGAIFRLSSSGAVTRLYSFCSRANCADGSLPHAPLVQAADGVFYGTTSAGGENNSGTVFSLSMAGGTRR